MIGALAGDIVGSLYEFDRGTKTKEFPLFSVNSKFTDDSVMTVAIADACIGVIAAGTQNEKEFKSAFEKSMRHWGNKYPTAGYGVRFIQWLRDPSMGAYNSYGNGSASRVSPIGWLFKDLDTTRKFARWSAEVSHNHPEGIKGAEAVASAIFMARGGCGKDDIKRYVMHEFGYDLRRTCDEIRPSYHHVESCQQTVPEAIIAFLEANDFEDAIRTAVSLGGDCDTVAAVTGSIAEAFWGTSGVQPNIKAEVFKRLPFDMIRVVKEFYAIINQPQNTI